MFHRLNYKISAYFVALIIVAMAVVMISVTLLVSRDISDVIQHRFNEAQLLLEQQLSHEARLLTALGNVASTAPRLVAAASTKDHETVLDIAQRFQNQFDSELFTVIDESGIVLARVHEPDRWGDKVLSDSLVANALKGISGSGLSIIDGEIYQQVAVPLISSGYMLAGALRLGYRIDDVFAVKLKNLTGTDITFFIDNHVVASSLQQDIRDELEMRDVVFSDSHSDTKFREERFRSAVIELPIPGVKYLVHRSIDRETAFRNKLQSFLF